MSKRGNRGDGSVFQPKGSDLWVAEVTVGYGPNGEQKKRRVYGKTKREATEKKAALKAEAQKGLLVDPSRETVGSFLTRWLDEAVRGTVRPNTLESYSYTLKHILPTLGKLKLSKLAPGHLTRLYREKQDEGLTSTVVQIHALLHKALGQALRWGLVSRNVADAVDPPRVTTKEHHPLTAEQAQTLLVSAADDRLHALYVLAVMCGLRQGELFGLRWSDIDMNRGSLVVLRQLQWIQGTPTFCEPKSAKGKRSIVLPKAATVALRRHRARQAEERIRLGEAWQDATDQVFTNTVGGPLDPSHLRRRSFSRLLERAGLPRIRFHDLRHTTATLLLGEGVHMKLVQEQLGHSRINMTLDLYSHVTQPMMRETASKMDALFSGTIGRPDDNGGPDK